MIINIFLYEPFSYHILLQAASEEQLEKLVFASKQLNIIPEKTMTLFNVLLVS